ncbi:hypothetical protein NDU88_003594 [Pleurodeles waltl]|uniref:Uncharacterized protein n=1 Tax=Pleurodeles waltl TaxID=8319 RepID=A0AAV7Q9E0_PLEWA|nr:hypothetical protein NDU88_003594 [Pleurodeles waltl]
MGSPVATWAWLQASTGPPTPVSPRRGGAAPSRGVAAPHAPSQQSIGPGLAAQKSPRPPALHSLWCRSGTPRSALLGRSDLALHEVTQSP